MFTKRLPFFRNTIEEKWRVNRLVLLVRGDNLDSLLGDVRANFFAVILIPEGWLHQSLGSQGHRVKDACETCGARHSCYPPLPQRYIMC